jgi:midasin
LDNITAFFSQFLPSVNQKIDDIKKPLLKDLKQYVQIASWKDVNVFALKESAKRTHHQLNKFMKKFRLSLSLSVKDIIARYHENVPILSQGKSSLSSIFDHLLPSHFITVILEASETPIGKWPSIATLYRKTKDFTTATLSIEEDMNTIKILEDFGDQIISRVEDFQSENASSTENGAKGQKMIRKKAWVDLLKELSELGLSPRCTQKYKAHQNATHMNSLPFLKSTEILLIIENLPESETLLEKAQSYHIKNLARLEIIRKLTVSRSSDISALEKKKSFSYLGCI